MRDTSVSLGQYLTDFVDFQVKGGRYGCASEAVSAGVRLLEEHESKLK